ncbi:ATP-binding protein [Thermomonospora catenispora]|uniref:ATP-binding protein n=1 Tax=Thermomonospora catenispora TaxID=2493090 RepID=UPI0011205E7C|nr:ATP-binding protein [Thermomonospora catenispora]TNY38582.1 ATP-binding protein [Thermomonospora catenispora]
MNQPVACTDTAVRLDPDPTGVNNEYLFLTTDPSEVGRARTYAEDRARRLGMGDLAYEAVLVTSELVTNAVREQSIYFPNEMVIFRVTSETAGPGEQRLRIEVTDRSPAIPWVRKAIPMAESGRGLMIVSQIARDMGYETRPEGGKTVWTVL